MPKQAAIAELVVGGKRYGAWKSFWLRRQYEATCSDFEFQASEPIDVTGAFQGWRIQPGDSCHLYLAGILALTGHIDVRQGAYNSREHGVMFRGRSNTADAVDSSASVSGGQYRGYKFEQIAQALLKPTGVTLVMKATGSEAARPFPNFSLRPGETVHQAIERLARLRGLRLGDDQQGNMVATDSGTIPGASAELIEGRNILEARGTMDVSNWYRDIEVRAQDQGSDRNWPTNDIAAKATNPHAPATRKKIILMEEPGSQKDAQARALHEMAFSGQAQIECSIVVQGWQSSDGQLWDTGKTYTVRSPMLDLDRALASRVVTYAQDSENGTITTIELCTPESLTGQADVTSTGKGDKAYSSDGATSTEVAPIEV